MPRAVGLIIPCYNEEKRLPSGEIEEFLESDGACRLFFVDDGSTDGTARRLAEIRRKHEDLVTVRIEVPGMERGDFDLDVVEGYLVVRGEKRVASDRHEGRFHVMECAYGSFERAVPLPAEVDSRKAEAHYRRGVLTVSLPKHQRVTRRRIPISHG